MFKNFLKKIIPEPLLRAYHYCLAFFGAFFYGFPSKNLKIVGVTGTSGKSTVVELTSLILRQAGFKTCSMSSVKFKILEKEKENMLKMTMPGRFKIQRFLRKAVKAGCEYAVLEVTSEGIKQYRHKFIDFKIALLTNLSKEHIESHKGFDNYKKAKAELFKACKDTHIINLDDSYADYFWQIPAENKIGFGKNEFEKLLPELSMLGEFNQYNALAAIKTAQVLGVSLDICQRAVKEFKGLEGRMEIVNKNPLVIVDYAHTPEALEQVYKIIKNYKPPTTNYRLICVLGSCGGGRDKWKRPVMGKIASQYCGKVIITNEDPYDENPMEIINQVAGDIKAEKILDRKEAIKKAVSLANSENAVIITGKGSEPWMCIARGKKIPWDDRKIVKEEMSK
jgi:UDP-N-acetylmuramoyl-L-alanyl-D-glutamate--2,6-diaminopimelate ligase